MHIFSKGSWIITPFYIKYLPTVNWKHTIHKWECITDKRFNVLVLGFTVPCGRNTLFSRKKIGLETQGKYGVQGCLVCFFQAGNVVKLLSDSIHLSQLNALI